LLGECLQRQHADKEKRKESADHRHPPCVRLYGTVALSYPSAEDKPNKIKSAMTNDERKVRGIVAERGIAVKRYLVGRN
jgi:hypothetical protein